MSNMQTVLDELRGRRDGIDACIKVLELGIAADALLASRPPIDTLATTEPPANVVEATEIAPAPVGPAKPAAKTKQWSPEKRAAQAERMRAMQARKKAERVSAAPEPPAPVEAAPTTKWERMLTLTQGHMLVHALKGTNSNLARNIESKMAKSVDGRTFRYNPVPIHAEDFDRAWRELGYDK